MSAGIKLSTAVGGSLTLGADDTLTTDEVLEIPTDGNFGITSGPGWIKYPDGTQMMWGVTGDSAIAKTGATTVVSFPIAFGYACENVTCTVSNRSSNVYDVSLGSSGVKHALSTTSFTVSSTGESSNTFGIYWQAIGRWKV